MYTQLTTHSINVSVAGTGSLGLLCRPPLCARSLQKQVHTGAPFILCFVCFHICLCHFVKLENLISSPHLDRIILYSVSWLAGWGVYATKCFFFISTTYPPSSGARATTCFDFVFLLLAPESWCSLETISPPVSNCLWTHLTADW